MDLLLAFIVAVLITMTLIPPLTRLAGWLHVVDQPGERKVHSHPIPSVGGLAMAVGCFVPLVLWLPPDRTLLTYVSASAVMIAFGVWDDRVRLGPWAKLIGQVIAVSIVVFAGNVVISTMTITDRLPIPAFIAYPLTIVFLLGVTNAINLSDGLDGLAGGTTLLSCGAIGLLALSFNIGFVAVVAFLLAGSLLGFLRFNTYPARIFMGDGGSQFLGFTVAVLSVMLTQNANTPLSAALPLLILGIPILDTLAVMALRIRRGDSLMRGDQNHIHHRLLSLGFDHHEAVVIIYCAQALMFISAWFLRFESDLMIIATFVGFAAVFLGLLTLGQRGWRFRKHTVPRAPSNVTRAARWLVRRDQLPRWAFFVAAAGTMAYATSIAIYAHPLPHDIGWLALGMALVLLIVVCTHGERSGLGWVAQGALYVAAVAIVYLDHQSVNDTGLLLTFKWLIFPMLVVAVVVSMRLSGERRFRLTSLDVLLIFAALAIPQLPGLFSNSSQIGLSLAKLVALFYAIELVSSRSARARRLSWIVAFALCTLIACHTFIPWT